MTDIEMDIVDRLTRGEAWSYYDIARFIADDEHNLSDDDFAAADAVWDNLAAHDDVAAYYDGHNLRLWLLRDEARVEATS